MDYSMIKFNILFTLKHINKINELPISKINEFINKFDNDLSSNLRRQWNRLYSTITSPMFADLSDNVSFVNEVVDGFCDIIRRVYDTDLQLSWTNNNNESTLPYVSVIHDFVQKPCLNEEEYNRLFPEFSPDEN